MAAALISCIGHHHGPYLLEWVTYHRLIGFDAVHLFHADAEGPMPRLVAAIESAGLARGHDISTPDPDEPAEPLNRAYRRALALPEVAGADWVLPLEADEFLNIHAGDGRLADLLGALPPGTDAVAATWRIFGNAGVAGFADRPVIGQFPRAAPVDVPIRFNNHGIRTLFRPGPVQRIGAHRPFFRPEFKRPAPRILWVNGSGEDVTAHFLNGGWASPRRALGYGLVQVNRYAIGAAESYLARHWQDQARRLDREMLDGFDANHDEDRSIMRWLLMLDRELERLHATHPGLAAAHRDCVSGWQDRIARLRAELEKTDPDSAARLFEPQRRDEHLAAQAAWLEARRKPASVDADAAPEQAAAAGDEADIHDEPPETEADALPEWLADLRGSDFRRGFYHSDDGFATMFTDRGDAQLVVAFDNLSSVRDPSLARNPWGYEFIRKDGHSQLGVMAFRPDWFRNPALFAHLQRLRDEGFFARFRRVALMGTSMGAYAAAAFAGFCPGATVIAFSPQSTLRADLVPWEKRFNSGRKADWSGPYADAAAEAAAAGRCYIFHDPGFEPDRRHAERFTGPNVIHLHTRHAGHKSALFLRRADLLGRVTRAAIDGRLTPAGFYGLYRTSRRLPWYLSAVGDAARARGRRDLVARVLRHIEAEGRAPMARAMAARLNEQPDADRS